MSSQPSKGVAAILAALLGPLGADKFYVGATGLGILQLILTITIIGLFISVPWAWLSALALVMAILFGGLPFLYPKVNWAPTTQTDRTIAWIIVGLYVLGLVVGIISSLRKPAKKESFTYRCDKCKKYGKKCQC